MNRFWVRILVFVGPMTAAGVIFGILEAALFTRSMVLPPPDAPGSNAAWAFPVSLVIALCGVWVGARLASPSRQSAVTVLLILLAPLFYWVITADITCALAGLSDGPIAYLPLAYLALYALLGVPHLIRQRRRTATRDLKWKDIHWPSFVTGLILIACTVGAIRLVFSPRLHPLHFCDAPALSGFSLALAWQMGQMAGIHFAAGLLRSGVLGGVFGAWTSVFVLSRPGLPMTVRTLLTRWALGWVLGSTISGLMFGGHAVMLIQTYRVAWNPPAVFVTSLWVWGILGVIGGLMLACAVHVASAEPLLRLRRVPLALALTVPPILAASAWTVSFVRVNDAGRGLLAKAQKLEGQTYSINFWPDAYVGTAIYDGRRLIRVRRTDESDQGRQRRSYSHTIGLCDELLARFPKSAYRSAALYLGYEAMSLTWQPRGALETRARLFALYPGARYQEWSYPRLELYDLMLVGDYGDVIRLSRDYAKTQKQFPPSRAEACAAEVLGMWDDLIHIQRARMADFKAHRTYRSPTYHQILAKWEAEIRRGESMKAKGVGPRPRTDVSGRVLLGGKALSGIAFCILPMRDTEPDTRDMTPTYAAAIGGRVAETDASGAYTIQRVPSGRYEVLLVLDPSLSSGAFKVSAPGVPYVIKGASVRLPDIVLTPSPGTKP
ncbi:MAG: hypothetical protein NTU88_12610 [Armatimonadetes bacterium]|nr:hypothetical protein [Armatimonadota bacterium]